MVSLEDDPRLQFLSVKACQGLSVGSDKFEELLDSSPAVKGLIEDFLDAPKPDETPTSLLVYLKVVEEVADEPAQEPEPEPEPVPEPEPATDPEVDGVEDGTADGGAAETTDEVAADGETAEQKDAAEEGEAVPDSGEDNPQEADNGQETQDTENENQPATSANGDDAVTEQDAADNSPAGPEPVEAVEEKTPEPLVVEEIVRQTVPVVKLDVCCGLLPEDAVIGRSFYFLRTRKGPLDMAGLSELECGVLVGGTSLGNMEQVLLQVYLPLLLGPTKGDAAVGINVASEEHNEMLSSLQKFISQVGHARQQLSGDIQLVIPDNAIGEVDQAIKDYDLLHALEGTVAEWATVLASAVQAQSQKGPTGSSPLAEIEFWRERNSALSSLYEQLNLPQARKIMAVVEAGSEDNNLLQSFKAQFTELTKLCVEARDNVKFLTTLERHFKNIANGPLGTPTYAPPMSEEMCLELFSFNPKIGRQFPVLVILSFMFSQGASWIPSPL